MKKQTLLIGTFFVLLFLALFLGDGKQPVVDVYGAAVVIVSWVYYLYSRPPLRIVPKKYTLPWVAVGCVALLSTVFSWSVGFSLSWLVRFVSGYLAYRLFFEIANSNTLKIFTKGSLFFAGGGSLLFLFFQAIPMVQKQLPSMNLIDARYGHSHLADILVFSMPLLFLTLHTLVKSRWIIVGAHILFIGILLFTFARGAWVLVGAFICYFLIKHKYFIRKNTYYLAGGIAILIAAIGLVLYFGPPAWFIKAQSSLFRPTTIEGRMEYWRQGIESLFQHPVLGSGPGTFSLVSIQYQRAPNQSSWFAHGQPIQILSEMGVFGFFTFLWLCIVHIVGVLRTRHKNIHHNVYWRALVWGVMLTAIYGSYEYVLDYFVVWLLFWASAGLLIGLSALPRYEKHITTNQLIAPLGFIILFYLLVMTSSVLVLCKQYNAAFYIAPFDGANALLYLDAASKHGKRPSMSLVTMFHKNNARILAEAASYLRGSSRVQIQEGADTSESRRLLWRAIELDPQNNVYIEKYIDLFQKAEQKDALLDVVTLMLKSVSPNVTKDSAYIRTHWKDISACFLGETMLWPHQTQVDTYQAKSLYFAGLCLIKNNQVDVARELFRMAVDARGSWSNIYIDYASLSLWRYKDVQEARRSLELCKGNPNARKHCVDMERSLPHSSISDDRAAFIP